MSKKQINSFAIEENERDPKIEEEHIYPVEPIVKMSLKDITREEKIRDAGKLLYLKRYE